MKLAGSEQAGERVRDGRGGFTRESFLVRRNGASGQSLARRMARKKERSRKERRGAGRRGEEKGGRAGGREGGREQ